MALLRGLLAALLLSTAFLLPAAAQEPHWLVGAWEGGRKNVGASSRTGSDRTLVVKSVARDGASGKAVWMVSTANVNVTLAIAGDVVSFTTPGAQGLDYRLVRRGETLEGTWTAKTSGNVGAVELKKK